MSFITIILTAAAAIVTMTLFSYVLSKLTGKLFVEPRLLGFIIYPHSQQDPENPRATWLTWLIHYGVGLVFVFVFDLIWRHSFFAPDVISGAVLGFCAGIVGVSGWSAMFFIKGSPWRTPLDQYFLQLIVAHIIFGITAGLVYPLLQF